MPFGPFHLPASEFGSTFNGAFVALRPDTAIQTLEAARKAGIRVFIHLAGGRQNYQLSNLAFSVAGFNAMLDPYKGIDFAPYAEDGTVIGHMLFDEPQDPGNWDGKPVPYKDIEAVAAYSKRLWPTLPVGAAGPPSFLVGGAPWLAVDFGFAQYGTARGDIRTFIEQQVEAAQQAGIGLAWSINVFGGNNRQRVTASQLEEWGTLLASEPYGCGLLMWKWDAGYFADLAIAEAVASVLQAARQHPTTSCQR